MIYLGNDVRKIDFIVNKGTFFINIVTSLVVYGFSAYLIFNGKLTVGLFMAIVQYVALLHKKFNWLLRIYLDWHTRKISIDRVSEILDSESENENGQSLSENINCIEFRNVSFGYNKNIVLNNISFSIHQGEHVAIVGTSGVGKTTITGLLLKFFVPQSGVIYVNGQNLQNFKYSDIRQNIGIVQQDILLFDETIRYNLLLGNKSCSDEELMEICKNVGLSDLITRLPHGLDTKIGINANDLSGGQKQRLMIARILIKKAATVIFDEATSALDVDTEGIVIDEFAKISKDTTMIVISHRLATIKSCDKIIVIHEGNFDHIGTHDELLKASKAYSDMFGKEEVVA